MIAAAQSFALFANDATEQIAQNANCAPGLVIDNFAGGGGASTGIEAALGRPIDVAINHDDEAVAMHTANHPHTRHYCQSVWAVDPLEVVRTGGPDGRHAGQPVALAWFSPDCKHFSKAKGGKPREKRIRDLAWVVIHWIDRLKPFNLHPRVIMLENVEEFRTWGPLLEDGKPCPDRKGETFAQWLGKLRRHGYKVEFRELKACDYGAPTIRKRLFMIARCDGLPIVWPKATHAKTPAAAQRAWRTASECIDWTIPCPSIFERQKPLAEKTLRRIAAGIKRFVLDSPQPFIVPICNTNWAGDRAWPTDEPLCTITTAKGGEMALVCPTLVATDFKNTRAARSFDIQDPLRTQTAQPSYALVATKIERCAAFMAQHNGGSRNTNLAGRALNEPISTIATRGTQQQLVTTCVTKLRGTNIGHAVDEPLHTVSAGGTHFAEIRALLIKYYGNEDDGHGLDAPLGTVTTKDRFALITVDIDGEPYVIVDIGMRMLAPHELFAAQGFPHDYILAAPRPDGKPLTKTAQVRMCGNSVSPPVPEALVAANIRAATTERAVA